MSSKRTMAVFMAIAVYGVIWSLKFAFTGNPGSYFIASPIFRIFVVLYWISVIYDVSRHLGRKQKRVRKIQETKEHTVRKAA